MGTHYIAVKKMKVSGEIRMPGDEVPEAAEWRSLAAHVARGSIAIVGDVDVPRVPVPAPAASEPAELPDEDEGEPDEVVQDVNEDVQDADDTSDEVVVEDEGEIDDQEAPEPTPVDVESYEVSPGWFEVPGHPTKVRRAEAEALLNDEE